MLLKLPLFCNHEEEYKKRLMIVKDYLDILSTPHSDCDEIHQNDLSCRDSSMDMFTIIYQICLIKFGKELYTEIMNYCSQNLFKFDNFKLEEAGSAAPSLAYIVHYGHCLPHIRATKFLLEFHRVLKRFIHLVDRLNAMSVIHLDRIYVEPTFHTNLRDRMNKAFCSEVCAKHMENLVGFARSHPHAIGHQMMVELHQMIYKVNPEVKSEVLCVIQLWVEMDDEGEIPEPPKLAPDLVENEPNLLEQFDEQCLEFHNLVICHSLINLNH